jgi:outer membrane protein
MLRRLACTGFAVFAVAIVCGGLGVAQEKTDETAKDPIAMPQPLVAVIDFQRVVKESAAGRSIREEIDSRHAQFQLEIKKLQEGLDASRKELSARPSGMSDAVYSKKRAAFRTRVNSLKTLIQDRKRKLDLMFNTGMREVDRALAAVLKELAEERGINLILNAGRGRGLVLFAESSIVITDEALRRLDARLPTARLTKPSSGK